MSKLPTIHDVARESGVSVATVSRVLANKDYPVSGESRKRVLEAARVLNYTPNAMGKSLKMQASREIGVLLPNLTNPYYAQLLQAIHDTADRCGYSVLLHSSGRDPQQEIRSLESMIQKRVAGILLASINPDPAAARRAMALGYPLVTLEQALTIPCTHIGFDYYQAGLLLVDYLVGLGHRDIGFIGAPLDRPSRIQMLKGYQDGLLHAGIAVRDDRIILGETERESTEVFEIENGRRCAERILKLATRPTACICLNDMTAIGAMRHFQAENMRIPEGMSLVGCDNIPYSQLCSPALTTIDQHAYQMGTLAVERLLDSIRQPDRQPFTVMLSPELIVRESCSGRATAL